MKTDFVRDSQRLSPSIAQLLAVGGSQVAISSAARAYEDVDLGPARDTIVAFSDALIL
jgi:hypothetical protein